MLEIMKEKKISVEELSLEAGISRSVIAKLRRGEKISAESERRISGALLRMPGRAVLKPKKERDVKQADAACDVDVHHAHLDSFYKSRLPLERSQEQADRIAEYNRMMGRR